MWECQGHSQVKVFFSPLLKTCYLVYALKSLRPNPKSPSWRPDDGIDIVELPSKQFQLANSWVQSIYQARLEDHLDGWEQHYPKCLYFV